MIGYILPAGHAGPCDSPTSGCGMARDGASQIESMIRGVLMALHSVGRRVGCMVGDERGRQILTKEDLEL